MIEIILKKYKILSFEFSVCSSLQQYRYSGVFTFLRVYVCCEDLSSLMHEKTGEIKIIWNWSDSNWKKRYFLKRMSLHKMIHPRCVSSWVFVSSLCLVTTRNFVTILWASAHVIWILCDLITAYNKLHIHAMPWIYYKRGCIRFAEPLLFVLRNRLIISRELSFKTDNLY